MRVMYLAAAAALVMSGPVMADDAITTAPAAGPTAPPPATSTSPLTSAPPVVIEDPQLAFGPCGVDKVPADGSLKPRPHGEVQAGVGTNGYRHLSGAYCQPLGENGAVAVSVSKTEFNGRYRHR
jgi:hypothetical protein